MNDPQAVDAMLLPPRTSVVRGEEGQALAPTRADAEAAVRTLILWAGEDPEREGLRDTPSRVTRAYEAFFAGYQEDPDALLATTFEEAGDFDDMVLVRNIRFESHCEHHLVPISGMVHVAYLPWSMSTPGACKYRKGSPARSRRPCMTRCNRAAWRW